MVKKWRGKGAKDSDDDDSDDDEEDAKPDPGLSLLEQRRAAFVKKKQETGGLSKKQRQEATLSKLKGFKKGMDDTGGGNDGTEAASWKSQPLKFEAVHHMAESASQYDSHDPLKHGTDGGRSAAKISARAKVMQSMKGGFFEDDDEETAAKPREVKKW